MYPALGRGRGHGANHNWTEPTPTSVRNEMSRRRPEATSRRDDDRRPAGLSSSRPAPVERPLTPEELAAIQAASAGLVLVTAEEHHGHKRHAGNRHGILAHVDPRRG